MRDHVTGIEVFGHDVSYADGAESELLTILEMAHDRSSDSDELTAAIHDWPTKYHFSQLRRNLLRPLTIGPGTRVLDIGCGTGVLCRFLGERGATVVGVEGTLDRARAAATRCIEQQNVTIMAGSVDEFESSDRFDVVMLIGVLEYASSLMPGGPSALLAKARSLLRPGGSLVVAIENQLGYKYLAGYHEDHVGLPWVGVEGYAGVSHVRTWSRRGLDSVLGAAGFTNRRFLFPYPDYKLPTLVIDESLFRHERGDAIARQLLQRPTDPSASAPELVMDDVRACHELLAAGLGPDTANSFLVIASDGPSEVLAAQPPLAWLFGSDRHRGWSRGRELIVGREGDLTLETMCFTPNRREWLSNRSDVSERWIDGVTLEELALASVAHGDAAALAAHVATWLGLIDRNIVDRAEVLGSNPFVIGDGPRLRPDLIDAHFANVVVDECGEAHLVDREWVVDGGPSRTAVIVRALWMLAGRIVRSGAPHLWSPLASRDSICRELCRLVDPVMADALDAVLDAEARFQGLIGPLPVGAARASLTAENALSGAALSTRLPYLRLRRDVSRADVRWRQVDELERRGDEAMNRAAALEARIAEVAADRALVAADRDRVLADREQTLLELESARREVQEVRAALEAEREAHNGSVEFLQDAVAVRDRIVAGLDQQVRVARRRRLPSLRGQSE